MIISSNQPCTAAVTKSLRSSRPDHVWNQPEEEFEDLQARLTIGEKNKPVTLTFLDDLTEGGLNEETSGQEMKAFKLVTWQPVDFHDLTILYQPMRRKPNIE
jgi:hypothetical protein